MSESARQLECKTIARGCQRHGRIVWGHCAARGREGGEGGGKVAIYVFISISLKTRTYPDYKTASLYQTSRNSKYKLDKDLIEILGLILVKHAFGLCH